MHRITLVALLLLVFVAMATPAADLISPLRSDHVKFFGSSFRSRARASVSWIRADETKTLGETAGYLFGGHIIDQYSHRHGAGYLYFQVFQSEGGVKLYGGPACTASEKVN